MIFKAHLVSPVVMVNNVTKYTQVNKIFDKLNRRKYAIETHVLVYQDDMAMEVHLIFWILDSPYLLFLNFVYT